MTHPDCLNWYTDCISYNHTNASFYCNIPYKYTNKYCQNYVKHTKLDCCNNFDDTCNLIYNWCIDNHPDHIEILDLFLGPKYGFTVGVNIQYYNNITDIRDCAQLCLDYWNCKSFDYNKLYNFCYLGQHVIGDINSNGEKIELIDDGSNNHLHYEKILNMPYSDTKCNVKYVSYLGDGLCDMNGGYNTKKCNYDGGDCCSETCNRHFFCGLFGYDCIDESVLYPPTLNPTLIPTILSPSNSPSLSPSVSPSLSPSNSPSLSPSNSPSLSPSVSPTRSPTINNNQNTLEPTKQPTEFSKRIEIHRSETQKEDKSALIVVIILVIIIIIISAVFLYIYLDKRKNKISLNSNYANSNSVKDNGFQNPLYDKNTDDSNISDDNLSDEDINEDTIYDDLSDEENNNYDDSYMYEDEDSNSLYKDEDACSIDENINIEEKDNTYFVPENILDEDN